MKKFALLLMLTALSILMTAGVYAANGDPFHYSIAKKDGTLYTIDDNIKDTKSSDNTIVSFYVDTDYIYYTAYSSDPYSYNLELYRCNKDLSNPEYISVCDTSHLICCSGSIYYTAPTPQGTTAIYSYNTYTGEIKKHITYTDYISAANVCDDYIYFIVSDKNFVTTKLYKQSIYDNTDKKLIYLTRAEYIDNYCLSLNGSIYINTTAGIMAIDTATGHLTKIIQSNNDDDVFCLLGIINGTIYVSANDEFLYYIDNNNELQQLCKNTAASKTDNSFSEYVSSDTIYFYSHDYPSNTYTYYEYDMSANKFIKLN